MANPTTNYGWPMPTSTDLVTDLPADFAAFGQPVDTSLKALNPETTLGDISYRSATANTNTRLPIGTTGQVLAVSGGVPAWTTTADVTPLTTKGDLFTFDTADARLGVGTNGQTLVADSTASTGLKWATPSAGALTLITSTNFSAVTTVSVNSCFSATYSRYRIIVNFDSTGGGTDVRVKMRVSGTDSSAASYQSKTMYAESAGVWQSFWGNNITTGFNALGNMPATGGILTFDISNPFQTQQTNATMQAGHQDRMTVGTWSFSATTSFDGLSFLSTTANTLTGNYKIYGYQES